MNAQRAQEAAGRHIEVHFADECELIVVDLADDTDADDVLPRWSAASKRRRWMTPRAI